MNTPSSCPVCGSDDAFPFLNLKEMPVSIGVQWPSRDQALGCKRGNLDLAICPACGFIWNLSFDPALVEYSQQYDNSLDYSAVFQDFARDLAERLIGTYGIRDKQVAELGCGKGHFLSLLCEMGNNRGVGFDPSFEGERVQSSASDRITYYQDFFGEKYTGHGGNLICCRHVFEHIPDPTAFLSTVNRTIGGNRETVVYFEVPNVRFILEKLSVWDVIYEHCNYFSSESLAGVFARSGFEILRLEESYGGQFLSLDARLSPHDANVSSSGPGAVPDLAGLVGAARAFTRQLQQRSESWTTRLQQSADGNKPAVIWGGGAKAVSFLNMLEVGENVPYVVDINPHKQGLFIPGTGQEIIPPERLRDVQPGLVILMNPIYRREIEEQLDSLGIETEIIGA